MTSPSASCSLTKNANPQQAVRIPMKKFGKRVQRHPHQLHRSSQTSEHAKRPALLAGAPSPSRTVFPTQKHSSIVQVPLLLLEQNPAKFVVKISRPCSQLRNSGTEYVCLRRMFKARHQLPLWQEAHQSIICSSLQPA